MPLITGSGGVITPPPPFVSTSGPVPLGLTYVDPDGQAWALADYTSGNVALSFAGIGGPLPAFTTLGLSTGGAIAQQYIAAIRTIVMQVIVWDDDQTAFLGRLDAWSRALWCQRAGSPSPGTFIVSRPDGSARQIQAYCTIGPDQPDDDGTKSGRLWSTFTLTFQSVDPFWSDADPIVVEFAAVPSGAGVPPMPPVILAPATVLGDTVVTNSGDSDAYPIWQIFGPGTPTLTNNTTGRVFGLTNAIGSGDWIAIDTRPTRQSVVDQDGTNQWADLVESSPRDLWQLVPGDNALDMALAGAGTGSKIVMSYTRRWLRS